MAAGRAQIVRWGNSLAMRIPKPLADEAEMREGDEVMIEVRAQGAIAVTALKRPPSLQELLAQITPENLHKEVDWGRPMGNEAW